MNKLTKSHIIAYFIVGMGSIIMLAPFYFMFVFATHTNSSILSVPPPVWFGGEFINNVGILLDALPYFWHNIGLKIPPRVTQQVY